jgi:uncharacterized protein (TIGR00369 family)
LQLSLFVDDATGDVTTDVNFAREFIGFADVLHGGILATVADEVMVWAATWAGSRFCLCAELSVRYRRPARPGQAYQFVATVEGSRTRLITTACSVLDADGTVVANATAKYVPVSADEHARVVATFLPEEDTAEAARILS